MNLIITAKYPHNQVKDIVELADEFVFGKSVVIKLPDNFKVWVKNSEYSHAGRFFGNKVVLRIGRPKQFPCPYQYPGLKTAPSYTLNDWKEALLHLTVHEFWHYYQMKTNSPYSEIETENRALKRLNDFREMRGSLEIKWKEFDSKVENKLIKKQEKLDHKETPQYQLEQVELKISKINRRLKLYQTKLKKLLRKQKFLRKKNLTSTVGVAIITQ